MRSVLLAILLLGAEAPTLERLLAEKRLGAAIRVERAFAQPSLVLFRGRFEGESLLARMSVASAAGDAETGAREVRLAAGSFEEKRGEAYAAFEPTWLGPACGLAAGLRPIVEGVAGAGRIEGEDLKRLLAPHAAAFETVHAVAAMDPAAIRCEGTCAIDAAGVATFDVRLTLGGDWSYRVTGALRAGETPTDPAAWGGAKGSEPIRLDDLPEPKLDAIRGAVAKGVDYLRRIQKADGSWVSPQAEGVPYPSQRVAITAVCLHALAVCGKDAGALRRGVAALERMAAERVLEDDPPAHGLFDFSVWGAAFGLLHTDGLLAHWPDDAPPDLSKLAERYQTFAWAKQRGCGGWNYRAAPKDGSTTVVTASMVEGLLAWERRGASVDRARLDRAIADLGRNRDGAGSFGYYHDGAYESTKGIAWTTPESAGRSVQAQLVLVLAGREAPESLDAPLRRFVGEYHHLLAQRGVYAHAPPYMIAGYYYHYGVHFAARALRHAPGPHSDAAKLIAHELLRTQQEEGGWVDSPAGGEPYATAMALLSLAEFLPPPPALVRRAADGDLSARAALACDGGVAAVEAAIAAAPPGRRAALDALLAELKRAEALRSVDFRIVLPVERIALAAANRGELRFAIEARNRSAAPAILFPRFSLRILDAAGEALQPSLRQGRSGVRFDDRPVLERVEFARLEPKSGWTRVAEASVARYLLDARLVLGWRLPRPGVYTLEAAYDYDAAREKALHEGPWPAREDPARDWNRAVEGRRAFRAKIRVE